MAYNPLIHNRQSIRRKGHDYSQPGYYFVTLCVQYRRCLFGEIPNRKMILKPAGSMIEHWWWELETKFPNIALHEFVVMPDHFHGLIEIVGADLRVRPNDTSIRGTHASMRGTHAGVPLGTMVQWFKTMTTNAYMRGVRDDGWPRFEKRMWQRNYHDRIIENEKCLRQVRNYIIQNPAKWNAANKKR